MSRNFYSMESFSENGFLIIKDALNKELCAAFVSLVESVVKFRYQNIFGNNNRNSSEYKCQLGDLLLDLDIANHEHIADISDFLDMTPEILQMSSAPNVMTVVRALLELENNDPLYISNNGIILSMPNDTDHTYGWHKDTFYTIPESNFIQLWAPLIERSKPETGTLKVAVGSHLRGMNDQFIKDGVPNRHKYQVSENSLKNFEILDIEMNVGEVMLFNPNLAHRSGINSSDRARFSLVSVYHQLNNKSIRPLKRGNKFKGKTPDQYFYETIGASDE